MKKFSLEEIDTFNPKDYWLAGWSYPENKIPVKRKKFKYDICGLNNEKKEFFYSGFIEAETVEEARKLIESSQIRCGITRLWCCIYKKEK